MVIKKKKKKKWEEKKNETKRNQHENENTKKDMWTHKLRDKYMYGCMYVRITALKNVKSRKRKKYKSNNNNNICWQNLFGLQINKEKKLSSAQNHIKTIWDG